VNFAAVSVPSQRMFIFVVVYFVIDSVRKLLDTPSYSLKQGKNRTRLKFFAELMASGHDHRYMHGLPTHSKHDLYVRPHLLNVFHMKGQTLGLLLKATDGHLPG
jgi:hypothetical protein